MFESIKELVSEIYETYSELSPALKLIKVTKAMAFSRQLKDTLLEVNELLPYLDCSEVPDYGLTLLDSLGVSATPEYGMELPTAGVYLYKALFFMGKEDLISARKCADIVLKVPEWRVIQGEKTLLEIKDEARRLISHME